VGSPAAAGGRSRAEPRRQLGGHSSHLVSPVGVRQPEQTWTASGHVAVAVPTLAHRLLAHPAQGLSLREAAEAGRADPHAGVVGGEESLVALLAEDAELVDTEPVEVLHERVVVLRGQCNR